MFRQPKFVVDSSVKNDKVYFCTIVLDLLLHIPSFANVLIAADPLDIIGTENERAAFLELKTIVAAVANSTSDTINIQPFLTKLHLCSYTDYSKNESIDILIIWDEIVKLIMVVIPPLREVFLGQVASAQEVPGWLNLMSRHFRAQFTGSIHSMEEIFRASSSHLVLASDHQRNSHSDGFCASNAMVLKRAPEILVISVESFHLRSLWPKISTTPLSAEKMVLAINFPESFDLTSVCNASTVAEGNDESSPFYDLTAVVSLDGPQYVSAQAFFRAKHPSRTEDMWVKGAGGSHEETTKARAVEGNFYTSSLAPEKRVHPRLLIYTRRDLEHVLQRTVQLVSKAGQMRALGDVAFALAMTTENYAEARRCYEEAIALDETLRESLQDNLNSLDKIERTQKARALEEQADLALANNRYRECNDLYAKAMMNAVVGSGVYLRVREKLESVARIISLEAACHIAEKGEEAVKSQSFVSARDLFAQAHKLHPEILHIHTLLVSVERTVQQNIVKQKTNEVSN